MSDDASVSFLWNIVAAKAILAGGLGAALLFVWRKAPLWLFAALFGIVSAASYVLFVRGAELAFWGLTGDETFVTAFFERVASGRPFEDFSYRALPPYYPPLFFWIFGGIAWLLEWNGVQAAKLGAAFSIALLPLASYLLQKRLWKARPPEERPLAWGMLLAAIAYLPAISWDAAILKPYETVAALLGVQLAAFFLAAAGERMRARSLLGYGAGFALLLLTYYFWGFEIAIAALLTLLVFPSGRMRRAGNCILVGVVALAASALFWLPYLRSLRDGFSPYTAMYLSPGEFDWFAPFLKFDTFGLLALAGIIGLLFFRREPVMRALGLLALTPYLWQIFGAAIFLFGGRPLVPGKPFLFFGTAAFVTAAGWTLGRLRSDRIPPGIRQTIAVAAIFVAALFSFGGVFIDQPGIRAAREGMFRAKEETVRFRNFFEANPDLLAHTYLSSGVRELEAFVPLDIFLQPTVHFSHPAARWEERVMFLEELARSESSKDFSDRLAETPWGAVRGLLLHRDGDSYVLFFQEDAWPFGTRERSIRIPTALVSEEFWERKTEIGSFFIFIRRES